MDTENRDRDRVVPDAAGDVVVDLPNDRRANFYLIGIGGVLALNLLVVLIDNRLARDCIVLLSILLIGLVFTRLFATFQCSQKVRVLLSFGVLSMVCAQIPSITEEIPALAALPILGSASPWNSFFDTMGMVTGLVLILSALVVAVVDLGSARDSVTREMTVRMEAQSALARHRDKLEDEVRARTAALREAQNELLMQERQAALGQIMSTVSHELRNPLGTVRGSLYTLQRGLDTGDTSRMAAAIARCERSIVRCDRIIEELQQFSNTQQVSPQLTSLDDWLGWLIDSTTFPQSVSCTTDLQADVRIPLDSSRMESALRHLLENSVDALEEQTERGGQLLVTSMKYANSCQIIIRDTGVGMTPDIMAQMAEPLFSTRAFGAGLGVPIAKETVRLHGGTVSYESATEHGTTVTIELPLQSA